MRCTCTIYTIVCAGCFKKLEADTFGSLDQVESDMKIIKENRRKIRYAERRDE